MELGGKNPRDTRTRWAAKIQRAENVGILFNSIQGDVDISG